jgi:hypothetical protein
MTWLRSMSDAVVIDPFDAEAERQVEAVLG